MNDETLVGRWRIDPMDEVGQRELGNVEIEFTADGTLTYTVNRADRWQHMFLTYEARGSRIYTDQPSKPGREVTDYYFSGDGKLVLSWNGTTATFVRVGLFATN